jgi:hypothetical protein
LASHLNPPLPHIAGGSGLDSRRIGPVRGRSGPRDIFFRNPIIVFQILQTLKIHKYFSVHANVVIQISLSSLGYYISDGTGLIVLEAL